eukprot:6410213-Pyramimonas_sp.AAC.1
MSQPCPRRRSQSSRRSRSSWGLRRAVGHECGHDNTRAARCAGDLRGRRGDGRQRAPGQVDVRDQRQPALQSGPLQGRRRGGQCDGAAWLSSGA